MLRFGSIFPLLLSLLRERRGARERHGTDATTGLGRARHRLAALTALALLLALAPGCAEDPAGSDDRGGDASGERTGKASAPLVGVDGALTVNTANTVVNQYAVLGADAAVGANSIGVTAIADLTSATLGPLSAGDLVMIIQMQGATIDASDTAQYGTVTALNNAGRYEIIGVAGTTGNTSLRPSARTGCTVPLMVTRESVAPSGSMNACSLPRLARRSTVSVVSVSRSPGTTWTSLLSMVSVWPWS